MMLRALLLAIFVSGCATSGGGGSPIYLIKIEKGDTLAAIAQKYDTSWEKIASLNELDPGAGLTPGTILRIPPGPGGLVAGAAPATAKAKAPRLAKRPPLGKAAPAEAADADVDFTEDDIPTDDGKAKAAAPAPGKPAKRKGFLFNGDGGASTRRFFQWPVAGEVSSGFGRRGRRPHEGIDIRAAYGTEILASGPGVVEFVGSKRGYGRTVIIRHGKWRSLYAHMSAVDVDTGDRVGRSTIIGKVGTSGNARGPHVHLELHDARDRAVDPRPLLPSEDPALVSVN